MIMRSPVVAMLWEVWRVTRTELAWKLALGVIGGLAVLSVFAAIATTEKGRTFGAVIAMILIVLPHFLGCLSLPRLNLGRPGFPLYLLYTRPVRTAVIVGVPMAYLIVVPSAIYLVSALLLRTISGHPFPLLPVAAWIAALSLAYLAINWSTRSRLALTLGAMAASVAWFRFAVHRLSSFPNNFGWHDSTKLWPTIFDFPVTDYALIALLGLAAFGVTVAKVAKQRRGDAPATVFRNTVGGYPDWLVNLIRFPCPTSSATRAQIWFELKSRGLPLLTIGAALATVVVLMCAISAPIDAAIEGGFRAYVSCSNRGCFYARAITVLLTGASLVTVVFLGGNAFGLRWRGRTYVSAFEATQAYGIARLAGLKLLVTSVCLLAVFIAVAVSAWTALPLLGDAVFIQMFNVSLSSWQSAINGYVAALAGYQQLALMFVAAVGVVVWVTAFAEVGALWARYPRRGNIAALLLLLSGLALALLVLARRNGILPVFLVDAIFTAIRWIAAAAMVFSIVYIFRSGLAERVLTIRHACGAVAISAAFAAAWVTVLHMAGARLAGMPATEVVGILWPVLLPLMASVLAPWSLSRIRHM